MGDKDDEFLKRISERDQLQSSIKSTAQMTGEMFKELQENGFDKKEAFMMTQTWLASLLGNMKNG